MALSIGRENLLTSLEDLAEQYDTSTLTPNFVMEKLENIYGCDLSDRKADIDAALKDIITSRQGNNEQSFSTSLDQDDVNSMDDQSSVNDNADPNEPIDVPAPPARDEPARRRRRSRTTRPRRNRSNVTTRSPKTKSSRLRASRRSSSSKRKSTLSKRRFQSKNVGRKSRAARQSLRPSSSKSITRRRRTRRLRKDSPLRKKFNLCDNLAGVVGKNKLTRAQLVKRMWNVIRERNLKDPANASYIICDPEMRRIFGRKRIRTFGMMKYLNKHLFDDVHTNQ